MEPLKYCSRGKHEVPVTTFAKSSREKDGLQQWCTSCKSEQQRQRKSKYDKERYKKLSEQVYGISIKRQYGISLEEYNTLLQAQNNVCAICGSSCPTKKRLAVDHCHSTGKVRGLLCMPCNRALGLFKDNSEIVENALSYLRKE